MFVNSVLQQIAVHGLEQTIGYMKLPLKPHWTFKVKHTVTGLQKVTELLDLLSNFVLILKNTILVQDTFIMLHTCMKVQQILLQQLLGKLLGHTWATSQPIGQ